MIAPKQVQEILDATRIDEVVGDFVSLRKRGVNLIGLCPFHNERTPSFNINPARNIFKCFGCGKGGDAITFLMEHEHLGYPDALRWLARKYNVQLEEVERTPEQLAEQQAAESLYILNDFAFRHFQAQLFETDEGKSVALSYFKQRGLREDTIRNFGLGYAPGRRDLFLQHAIMNGYSADLLKKLGLCNQDGTRDFFWSRVMFSIHNLSGKVAAFAGRTMSTDKSVPKYINSPETEIYVKNKILYGAFQAKKAIRQKDECILVEGYMDVLSLHQAGIENVVASSGTSLTEGQIQLIKRNTSNLKILYDGDPAGIKAALRGLDLALEQDMNVRIALLPASEDPDSYVQKYGGDALLEFMDRQSRDFILFKTDLLLEETKGDPIKKAALTRDIVASIAKIPDPIKRSLYLKECASILEVSEEALVGESNKMIASAVRKKSEKDDRETNFPKEASEDPADPAQHVQPAKPRGDEYQERHIVKMLLEHGNKIMPKENQTVAAFILEDIDDLIESFDSPFCGQIVRECAQFLKRDEAISHSYFTQHIQPEIRSLVVDLLMDQGAYSHNWEDKFNYPLQNQPLPEQNYELDSKKGINIFKQKKLRKVIDLNMIRIKTAEETGDLENGEKYKKVHQKLLEVLNELAKKGGTVVFPK